MPQHGPRPQYLDPPGNRHIPPKLTRSSPEPRLHGTGETARLGPSKSSRATAHRETGESLHGPPAPPSPSARTSIRGESAAIQPCHFQQAPAERTASSETFHVDGARSYAGQEPPTPLTCPGRVARNRRPAVRIRSWRWRLVPLPCHGMAAIGTGLAIGHLRPGHRDPYAHCPRYARRCTCGSSWAAAATVGMLQGPLIPISRKAGRPGRRHGPRV